MIMNAYISRQTKVTYTVLAGLVTLYASNLQR
jgi:hypothetical protein